MPSEDKVFEIYSQTHSFAATGAILGVSRQRVHQIIKGYKNFGRKNREKLYDSTFKENCEKCLNKPSVALHHIDGDNLNDDRTNLISLCLKCHSEEHIKHVFCKNCKTVFSEFNKKQRYGLCSDCFREASSKKELPHLQWNERRPYCIKCKRTSIPHKAKGECNTCYVQRYK